MALNETTARIGNGCQRATAVPSLVQWDRGQILKIEGVTLPQSYKVEFCCKGDAQTVPMIGDADGVEIPNTLLEQGLPIIAYIVLYEGEDDRETEYWITIQVMQRPEPNDEVPDPGQQSEIDQLIAALTAGVEAAEDAAEAIQNMDSEAETLQPGSPATVEKTVDPETGAVTLTFGIPKGDQGNPGTPGDDGYSPTVTITTITGGHRISVTDKNGTVSFDVLDGSPGDPGTPGDDGYSPAVTITTITGGHRVKITDKTHQSGQTFDVLDGVQGDPGTPGDDGYSPAVTITTITGGHRITITDKTHPNGQSFDVMDGEVSQQDLATALAPLESDIDELDVRSLLTLEEIPDTVQTYTFTSGNLTQLLHSRNNAAVRTDAFTYGTNTLTEVRTLSSGESLTIVTNLTTLETTITYSDGGGN